MLHSFANQFFFAFVKKHNNKGFLKRGSTKYYGISYLSSPNINKKQLLNSYGFPCSFLPGYLLDDLVKEFRYFQDYFILLA